MAAFDLDSVDRLLTTTKAVRKRLDLDRPVDRATITECIRLACHAPNASNAQEWRWVVVDDAEQRARIGELYRNLLLPRVTQMLANKEADGDAAGARISRSIIYLAERMHEVPVHVIPCFDLAAKEARYGRVLPDPGPLGRPEGMDPGSFASILPAVWSFQLALHSRGLGSAMTTAHQLDQPAMAAILGIPTTWYQVALIPVAHTIGEGFSPSPRRPVDEVIIWNHA
jgi:nitroreductase